MSGAPATLDDAQLKRIRSFLLAHESEMLTDLRSLVELETPSEDLQLLAVGRDAVRALATRRLGEPRAARMRSGSPHAGDMFALDFAAHPAVVTAPVALIGHYDTVWPVGTLSQIPAVVSGDRITGPGVFDMKAGLVQAIWAVRALAETGTPSPPVRLVINGDEETGSLASRSFLEDESRDAVCALVFEASAGGRVKTARKGVGIFRVDVTGVEAHAGLDPTRGASAVHELARIVSAIVGMAQLSLGTSVNVGVIAGGTRTNVSAGHAYAQLDVRISSASEAARIDAALAALEASESRLTVRVSGGWNRPTFERSSGVAELYALAAATATGLGFSLGEASVGGASDGNFVAALGVPVLDGVGAVGDGAHARHEFATVSGMIERSALAAGVIAAYCPAVRESSAGIDPA